jgi:hypothetical protein
MEVEIKASAGKSEDLRSFHDFVNILENVKAMHMTHQHTSIAI